MGTSTELSGFDLAVGTTVETHKGDPLWGMGAQTAKVPMDPLLNREQVDQGGRNQSCSWLFSFRSRSSPVQWRLVLDVVSTRPKQIASAVASFQFRPTGQLDMVVLNGLNLLQVYL